MEAMEKGNKAGGRKLGKKEKGRENASRCKPNHASSECTCPDQKQSLSKRKVLAKEET
jgi:hypothetical protein